jgi:hypothetical protein
MVVDLPRRGVDCATRLDRRSAQAAAIFRDGAGTIGIAQVRRPDVERGGGADTHAAIARRE